MILIYYFSHLSDSGRPWHVDQRHLHRMAWVNPRRKGIEEFNLFTNANTGNYLDANKYIIADSAYPLKRWLITPFKDNGRLNAQQRRFNKVLSSARQVVERSIGHLKKRFRRLTEVTIHHPEEIVKTIVSGCILHNLCIIHEDSVEDLVEINDDGHPNHCPNMYIDGQDGMLRRQQLIQVLPWTELFFIVFVQVVDNRKICTWHVYFNNNKGPWPTSIR